MLVLFTQRIFKHLCVKLVKYKFVEFRNIEFPEHTLVLQVDQRNTEPIS